MVLCIHWIILWRTSSSCSFLKHRHAARRLKPSPSYVLVWLGLNFMMPSVCQSIKVTICSREAKSPQESKTISVQPDKSSSVTAAHLEYPTSIREERLQYSSNTDRLLLQTPFQRVLWSNTMPNINVEITNWIHSESILPVFYASPLVYICSVCGLLWYTPTPQLRVRRRLAPIG